MNTACGSLDGSARSDAAHAANAIVRDFVRESGDESPGLYWDFLCECGCLRLVRITLAEFDAQDGARLPGHSDTPPAG